MVKKLEYMQKETQQHFHGENLMLMLLLNQQEFSQTKKHLAKHLEAGAKKVILICTCKRRYYNTCYGCKP